MRILVELNSIENHLNENIDLCVYSLNEGITKYPNFKALYNSIAILGLRENILIIRSAREHITGYCNIYV